MCALAFICFLISTQLCFGCWHTELRLLDLDLLGMESLGLYTPVLLLLRLNLNLLCLFLVYEGMVRGEDGLMKYDYLRFDGWIGESKDMKASLKDY